MDRSISHLFPTHLNSLKECFLPSSQTFTGQAEVLVLNQDGQILYLNDAARKHLDAWGEKHGS